MNKNLSNQIAYAIMKLSVIPLLLFLSVMCCYAKDTRGQKMLKKKITLKFDKEEIKKVFSEIERITDAKFVYSPELVDVTKTVNVDMRKEELANVLTNLLRPFNVSYEVINNYIILRKKEEVADVKSSELVSIKDEAIVKKVSGKITSSAGQPLEGVSIVVKNSSNGTSTNKKGEFTLMLESNQDVLVVSYTGYQSQEITVSNKNSIEVQLVSVTEQLGEVVVIGYGTQKKTSVTGAISTVGGKDIKSVPVPAISNSLAGRLTGVIGINGSGEPGYDDANILIRGLSTTGDNSPLIVIDGVADRAGGFSRLDANDIETITVLKDASAAIYGSRSANGVILVTTKRGSTGKPVVNYTFNYGLRQPTRLPKMLDAATYAQAFNEIEQNIYNRSPRYTADDIQKFKDGSDPYNYPNTNWYDVTLKPVSGQYQQNVSVSGGSDRVKYYFSIGNQYQDGYYKKGATNYRQYNVRSNIDAQVSNNLKLFLNMAARQEDRTYPHDASGTVFNYTINGVPTTPAYLPGTNLPGPPLGGDANPVEMVTDHAGYQKEKRTYLNGDLGFTLDMPYITKGISVIGGVYIDKSFGFYKSFYKNHYLYTLGTNDDTISHTYGPNNAQLSENMSQDIGITTNVRLNYARKIGDHDLTAFVAYEQYTYRYDNLTGTRSNYISTQIDQLFAGGNDPLKDNNGSASETARQNYFGRVGYGFKDKYLFQFNWRYDGSVNFPKNKRFGFFPGVSAGWRISQEDFMKSVNFVNSLKLRGSYGQLGNDRIPNFQYISAYNLASGGVFGGASPILSTSVVTGVLANPNITWEVSNAYNLGLDAQLFNNSISLTAEWFYTKRTNILLAASNSVPQYLGLLLPDQNLAKAENRGFEVAVNYKKTAGAVNFQVGVNFTYSKSKILYIGEASNIPDYQKLTGRPIDAVINKAANGGPWLLYKATGLFRSQADLDKYPHLSTAKPGDLIFEDVNKDGVIDGLDRVQQDNTSTPKIVYGIPVNITYKGFNLNMLWQGQAKVYQYVYFNSGEIGNFTQQYWDDHWTPDKPNASGPRLYDRETIASTQYINTYFYRDASFIRLKSLQLGYSFPKRILDKLPFSNLQVYVSGFNLLTFDKLKYIDPEGQPAGGTGNNYAGWYTPQTRVFNFGINVNF